jgi:hypothetical protein
MRRRARVKLTRVRCDPFLVPRRNDNARARGSHDGAAERHATSMVVWRFRGRAPCLFVISPARTSCVARVERSGHVADVAFSNANSDCQLGITSRAKLRDSCNGAGQVISEPRKPSRHSPWRGGHRVATGFLCETAKNDVA